MYTIHKQMLANLGHRFGHQSGLYDSSGQNSAAILSVFAPRDYLVLLKICTNGEYYNHKRIVSNAYLFEQNTIVQEEKTNACGKSVQSQTGHEDTNSYENVIYVD